jgi:hypothetical protein
MFALQLYDFLLDFSICECDLVFVFFMRCLPVVSTVQSKNLYVNISSTTTLTELCLTTYSTYTFLLCIVGTTGTHPIFFF